MTRTRWWAGVVLLALFAVALAAPWIAPHAPELQLHETVGAWQPPSWAHPMGTDSFARDVLSRVIHGGRVSLTIAGLAVIVALAVGGAVGATAALAGGVGDALLMRATDTMLAIPRLLLLLLAVASFGAVTPTGLALLLGATGWMGAARLVRQETLRLLTTDYVRAARALGVPPLALLRRHILPGLAPTLAVAAVLAFAAAVPLEAGLSYLGIGVRPPIASWGNIILDAESRPLRHWWLVLFPVLAITVSVLAANVLAERIARTDERPR